MSHIFISYSHKDTRYAHTLANALQARGFEVWIDERLDYGSQWPHELQKQLDSCGAFIVIMSPRSFASEWVQSELQRARRKLKPVFPVLLEGDEPWLSVESTQYFDVHGGILPDERFFSALGRVVPQGSVDVNLTPTHPARKAESKFPKWGIRALVAILGIVAIISFAVWLPSLIKDGSTDTPQESFASSTDISAEPPDSVDAPEDFVDEFGVPMRLVPAGEFTMGLDAGIALEECLKYSEECQRDWFTNEEPLRQIYVGPFYMDTYEVTNARYRVCVDEGDCDSPLLTDSSTHPNYVGNPEFDNYPVIHVDFDMAEAYCNWRDAQLPTEAEWEKAARGTDGRLYPWGSEIDPAFANYAALGLGDTAEAGNFANGVSPYGLFDMAGNVWEWVADWYGDSYYQFSPLSDPPGPEDGQFHVLRGGSWADTGYLLRTSVRGRDDPSVIPDNGFGFRCVRSVP